MQRHNTPVLPRDEGVLSSIAPKGFGDGQAMDFPDGHIVETLVDCELNLDTIFQPAAFDVILVHLKLQSSSLLLKHLHI